MGKRKIWKAGDSMSDAVIVAIVTLVGTIITVLAANKHTLAELDKKSASRMRMQTLFRFMDEW